MDTLFSVECKELVSKSREIAIELGYDYISTVHFFLADCENDYPLSIKKFAFKDDNEYLKFKDQYKLAEQVDYLDRFNDSLPLTKEAEAAIRLSGKERQVTESDLIYPFHFIIASFKIKNSILSDYFRHDPDVLEKLQKYYKDLGVPEFKTTTVDVDEIISRQKKPFNFLLRIFKKQQ